MTSIRKTKDSMETEQTIPLLEGPSCSQLSSLYAVELDFDAASAVWRRNKKKVPGGAGGFQYVCGCSRTPHAGRATAVQYCRRPCYKNARKAWRILEKSDAFLPGMWSECWYHFKMLQQQPHGVGTTQPQKEEEPLSCDN